VDYESLVTIQGYAKFFFLLFLTIVFYSYAFTIYKRQRSGEKDYEIYTDLVLNDSIDSQLLEDRKKNDNTSLDKRGQKLEKGER